MQRISRARGSGQKALRIARASLANHIYHITTTTFGRRRLFADFYIARTAVCSLNSHALLAGNELLAWVLMPDHLHMLVKLCGENTLAHSVNRLKSGVARSINRKFGARGPVWQRAYHDHLLRREEDVATVARYIIANPIRAGMVKRAGEYPHWDAIWLQRS